VSESRYVETPRAGTVWEGVDGDFVTVLTAATLVDERKILVVYQGGNGVRWACPLDQFTGKHVSGLPNFEYVTG
jgi:hypothetical protein